MDTKDSKLEEFFKRIEEFNEIKTGIEELKDRVADKVTLVWDKAFFEPTSTSRAISIKDFKFNFSLHFDGEVINDNLALQRAEAVKNYLLQKGAQENQIQV